MGSITNISTNNKSTTQQETNTSTQSNSYIYISEDKNFIAIFPNQPEVDKYTSTNMNISNYQYREILEDDFIQYTITIVEGSGYNLLYGWDEYEFLEQTFSAYYKSMGRSSYVIYQNKSIFLNRYKSLKYKFNFQYQNRSLTNEGLYFSDGKRVFKLSLSYTSNLNVSYKLNNFINNFALAGDM